jgi:hypothetical protein
MRARPVGSAASDIDLVFDAADRPGTVTALLAACISDADGQALGEDVVWGWTLNRRLQALLAVRLASDDTKANLRSQCTDCGEAMEIGLDLQAFANEPVAPRFTWKGADSLGLSLRLPRGQDLRNWMRDGGQVSQEALLASLVEDVSGQPQSLSTLLPALDDAFEAHDPLTALHLSASCPACAQVNTVGCDLEALLLDGFARAQAAMLDDVVQLASAFHWTEAAILALPRWRRALYLQRISQENRA